ncbi:oxidoreductase [Ophiobolus disseminans]|uniref:Oxidoreductase n=1 Tax=Ophiobolus disseminans TaxID=1469910 RepID=A0A6A7ABP0_9PLEO|nr:oxidoreductase [Ophiobolus disseminans]
MPDTQTYDFIIVGAGPSGASLSSRLASYLPHLSILLLEAGPPSASPAYLYDRYTALKSPDLNYAYETAPQEHLHGRRVDYSRGKGLGGTSLINFALWNRGARDDWDEIAHLVGSEEFKWTNVKETFDGIENVQPTRYTDIKARYVSVERETHGPVHVQYAPRWESFVLDLLRGIEEYGWEVNRDLNSGDPVGVGLGPATAREGVKVTARTAYLDGGLGNLHVRTGGQVARVVFEGKRAVGLESVDGEQIFARKEVILSAGALDTPKLLLLSGVGPKEDLEAFNISVVHDLPGVGKNLQDHCHFPISAVLKEGIREPNLQPGSDVLATARLDFAADGTGPLSYVNGSYVMGFLKDSVVYESKEFKSLDARTQAHLQKATVPLWEFGTGLPLLGPPPPGPPRQYLVNIGVLMNPQSRGVVTLQNSDPKEPALFDPRLMSHPYDEKVLKTAAKRILAFMKTPAIATTIDKPANMPPSDSDEDVLAFVKLNLKSTWHMSGTCKMGGEEDEMAVVNAKFEVRGVERLKVVDLSVLPFLVNAHPVAAAYLVGELAAKSIAECYGTC